MASVVAADIPEEQAFMSDLWNFRKKYYKPESNNDYWKAVVDETNALSRKYNSTFVNEMLLLCCNDIDRRYHEQHPDPAYRTDKDWTLELINMMRKDRNLPKLGVIK